MEILKKLVELIMAIFSKPVPPEKETQGEIGSAETASEAHVAEAVEKLSSPKEDGQKDPYPKAKNNSDRIKKEIKDLEKKNETLHKILMELTQWVSYEFNKDVVVTMILRTQAEQDAIYKGYVNSRGRSYDENPWKSPHQFWHGIDLRSWIYTESEREKMVDWLNKKGEELGNYYGWTAKVHTVGKGMHFHVQFWPA